MKNFNFNGNFNDNNSLNILKVNQSFSGDIGMFPLTSVVFPIDKATLQTYIASLSEPYKTYLAQLAQIHPLADWDNDTTTLLSRLSKSGYNIVIDNNYGIGVVVGIINATTMQPTNPDTLVCIRITSINAMEKFGEVYGTYGDAALCDSANSILSKVSMFYDPSVKNYTQDIEKAKKLIEETGIKDKEIVSVKIESDGRSLVFGDVVVRVRDDFALAAHIDTDESNAANAGGTVYGRIVK